MYGFSVPIAFFFGHRNIEFATISKMVAYRGSPREGFLEEYKEKAVSSISVFPLSIIASQLPISQHR